MQLQNEKYNGLTDKIEWTEKKYRVLYPFQTVHIFADLHFFILLFHRRFHHTQARIR